ASYAAENRTNISYWGKTEISTILYTQRGIFQAIASPKIMSELTTIDVQSSANGNLLLMKMSTCGPLQTFIWRPGAIPQHTQVPLGDVLQVHNPLVHIKTLIPSMCHQEQHATMLIKQPLRRKSIIYGDSFHASKFKDRERSYSRDQLLMSSIQEGTRSKNSNLMNQSGEIEKTYAFNLRTNLFQVGEDDMILPSLKHDEEKVIKQLDKAELIQRDITQSRAKELPRGVQ
ncbi:unnamed protein product, partial [Cochlearia groenlandica]